MDVPDPVSFLGAQCPSTLRLRTLTLEPHAVIDYRQDEWADALVVVERGELDIECRSGARVRFTTGAVLVLADMPLRHLRNPGSEPLVLSAVSRVRPGTAD